MSRTRLASAGIAVALLIGLGLPSASTGAPAGGTYRNPVSKTFADTFADPALLFAKDGYWYAYGTTDPLREGEGKPHYVPIARSNDLVNWRHVGDAFTRRSLPSWADKDNPDLGLWAPDIRYFDGKYHLYYVVTETTVTPEGFDNAIGVATSRTPVGPWRDSGRPLVGPRQGSPAPGDFKWTFDPSVFTDTGGKRYLYYGSYYGGIFGVRLSQNGMRTIGRPTQVTIDNRYEGAYVIRRGRFYYLFVSAANCCAGPTTGYSVFAGRAPDPLGPFKDRHGDSLLESRVGGSLVISPNGNTWIGTGHNALATDVKGRSWFVYHALNRRDPYLDEPYGINQRPMLLDRLDWKGGWPTVRSGRWASQGRQRAPATRWRLGSEFPGPAGLLRFRASGGPWVHREAPQSGGHVVGAGRSCRTRYLVSDGHFRGNRRAEADVRLAPGSSGAGALVARFRNRGNLVGSWIDAGSRSVTTQVRVGGATVLSRSSTLPEDFRYGQWHNLAAEIRGRRMTLELTDARLEDPIVRQQLRLPAAAPHGGSVGVAARCTRAAADNVGAARLFRPVHLRAPVPAVGDKLPFFSDEFNRSRLEPAWSFVRDPGGEVANGVFRWRTQAGDLAGPDTNDAPVLLRRAPRGRYTLQTKLRINLGTDEVHNYQQGGLAVYVHDDLNLRLTHVSIWNTRQTEFGKDLRHAGSASFGGMNVGTPAPVTYLRVSHRRDPRNREHEFRAATSRDGRHWTWGGVWTLPARTRPRIGLVSFGWDGQDPTRATSRFEYFRVLRP